MKPIAEIASISTPNELRINKSVKSLTLLTILILR